jgi:hypothetical protein
VTCPACDVDANPPPSGAHSTVFLQVLMMVSSTGPAFVAARLCDSCRARLDAAYRRWMELVRRERGAKH